MESVKLSSEAETGAITYMIPTNQIGALLLSYDDNSRHVGLNVIVEEYIEGRITDNGFPIEARYGVKYTKEAGFVLNHAMVKIAGSKHFATQTNQEAARAIRDEGESKKYLQSMIPNYSQDKMIDLLKAMTAKLVEFAEQNGSVIPTDIFDLTFDFAFVRGTNNEDAIPVLIENHVAIFDAKYE